ncbi:MAG: HPr(Ser) kinase/phosphatase [Clostridia bacterium]|nr:HPr(Ser) kinase/phosphatase [Clostridia bacterium]MBR5991631.1 HPr(Ser) kinase/phosphatase [Clostridia bacterium]MBR6479295.1 HPr(Ser) kinase/phosphatase [Clostridia bacterium]MBR6513014.1 HPr(Ser) kinase/phosphatase [Clostridia bacterium]
MATKYSVPLSKIIASEGYTEIYSPTPPEEVMVSAMEVSRPGLILARDDVNFSANRIQFIGNSEQFFLKGLPEDEKASDCIDRLMSRHPKAIVFSVSVDQDVVDMFMPYAKQYEVPLLRSESETSFAVSSLVSYLNVELAERETRHGVLVEVFGEGVLITGDSGVGKSENVVELINRGHRLVADDAVEIRKVSKRTLVGSAPDNIRHFIELRGVGIIDARRLFGMKSVKNTSRIDLVVDLEPWDETKAYERMGVDEEDINILGVNVPLCTVPVSPGRNLAVIIEVAAINNRQKKMGYNSAKELLSNLGMIEESENDNKPTDLDVWHNA